MVATAIDLSAIKTDALSAASTFRTLIGLGTLATQSPTGTPSASNFLRGDYSWSAPTDTGLRAYFLPPAPTSVTGTSGDTQVSLSWSAPTVIAQIPITDYVIQYSSNGGTSWTTFSDGTSTSTSATVTGLTNNTAYVFRVAAVNGLGQGTYSAQSASVTPARLVVDYLVVAGGGGGGWGGGGGAGGRKYARNPVSVGADQL